MWVGEGSKPSSDGTAIVSADKLRQYRPPTYKPKLGITQSNFEWRSQPRGPWIGDGHLDIIDAPKPKDQ